MRTTPATAPRLPLPPPTARLRIAGRRAMVAAAAAAVMVDRRRRATTTAGGGLLLPATTAATAATATMMRGGRRHRNNMLLRMEGTPATRAGRLSRREGATFTPTLHPPTTAPATTATGMAGMAPRRRRRGKRGTATGARRRRPTRGGAGRPPPPTARHRRPTLGAAATRLPPRTRRLPPRTARPRRPRTGRRLHPKPTARRRRRVTGRQATRRPPPTARPPPTRRLRPPRTRRPLRTRPRLSRRRRATRLNRSRPTRAVRHRQRAPTCARATPAWRRPLIQEEAHRLRTTRRRRVGTEKRERKATVRKQGQCVFNVQQTTRQTRKNGPAAAAMQPLHSASSIRFAFVWVAGACCVWKRERERRWPVSICVCPLFHTLCAPRRLFRQKREKREFSVHTISSTHCVFPVHFYTGGVTVAPSPPLAAASARSHAATASELPPSFQAVVQKAARCGSPL